MKTNRETRPVRIDTGILKKIEDISGFSSPKITAQSLIEHAILLYLDKLKASNYDLNVLKDAGIAKHLEK